jgi:hypothetical protein
LILPARFDVAFRPRSPLQFQAPNKKTNLSTIATVVSLRKASVGEMSDAGVELDRAGSNAVLPEMEREKGEEKALAAEASLSANAANRDTDGFRNCHNALKTQGHTIF